MIFFRPGIIFQTVSQFSFGSPCEMHPPTLRSPVFPLQLNFYVLVPWHCLQSEMWFQTLFPCEHFSGVWQGMAPMSQTSPISHGSSNLTGWPSFLLQWRLLKLWKRNKGEFQNLSIFHRNTNPMSFQFSSFINRATKPRSSGEAEQGDYLARPGRQLCSCSWYLIQQRHTQLIPAGSYHFSFCF